MLSNLAAIIFFIFKSLWEVVRDKSSIFGYVHANFEQFHLHEKLRTLEIYKSRLPYISSPCFSWSAAGGQCPIIILSQKTDFFLFVPVKFTAHCYEIPRFSDLIKKA